jgi:hypothetical protein
VEVGKEFVPSYYNPWNTMQAVVHIPEDSTYNLKDDQRRKIRVDTFQPIPDQT